MGERSDAASLCGEIFSRGGSLRKTFLMKEGCGEAELFRRAEILGVVARVGNREKRIYVITIE